MNQNDEVIYIITITGLKDLVKLKQAEDVLKEHIGAGRMVFSADQIDVPRLFTRWNGDATEQAWSATLTAQIEAIKDAHITISVTPWEAAEGYPMGDLTI